MMTESLTRFLAVVTTDLLNFISSRMTATLPLSAAMCAQVIPFYNRETLIKNVCACKLIEGIWRTLFPKKMYLFLNRTNFLNDNKTIVIRFSLKLHSGGNYRYLVNYLLITLLRILGWVLTQSN